MPFEPGNQEHKKADHKKQRAFKAELEMALAEVDASDRNGLRRIAEALIRKAEAEDVAAIREIADRIDGKVPQAHRRRRRARRHPYRHRNQVDRH